MIQSFDYFGVRLTKMSPDEFVETIDAAIAKNAPTTASYLHFHTVNLVQSDREAAVAFQDLDLLTPDGIAVLSTGRFFGPSLARDNILVMEYALPFLGPVAIAKGWSFFLFGGAPGVAARGAEHLEARFPGIRIAGTHHGYISTDEESEQVIEKINEAAPAILLVGMGQPKQEKWVARYRHRLNAKFVLCVGGFIEKLSRRESVYPKWVYRFHVYWLYRLMTEPRRVWRRYTFGGFRFAGHLSRQLIARRPPRPIGAQPDKRRLRILFLNHNVVRGGGTFFRAFDAARYLARRGHSVTLLSISPESRWGMEREDAEGVEIIHTPDLFWGIGRSGWDPWDVLWRIRFVAGRKWDLIQAWDSRPVVILPALAARLFSRKRNAKLIIDWSDWWGRGGTQMERGGGWTRYLYNAIETFFEERFRRFADGTTVISTSLRDRAVSLGVPREKVLLLPQGCEPPRDAGPREPARRELGIGENEKLFITVGVLNVSDAKLLFDVIRRVLRELPDSRFALIGRTRLKLPADLLVPRVTETGFVSTSVLTSYVAAADAFVVPLSENLSSRARWPSRVNTALSRGVPIVVSRVGDLPRFLEHENAAFVADPTAEDLARKIMDVVRDPAAAMRVQTAAKRVATLQLSWHGVIDQLEDFYNVLEDR
jgi:exopolysaccharide biosynthesis WecB/TagA/CpsF family protein